MNLLTFSSPLKRFYKFLLKRILGSFLQYELDLNQLDVQLGKGEVILKDLELNVQMLNELCVDLPITFIRARIRFVKATIPWRSLLTKNCILKLDGWELVIVPSEQVQHKSSGTFSTLLAQSVMSEIDPRDLALQASLASLGQHFRPGSSQPFIPTHPASSNQRRGSNSSHTPLSLSGSASAFSSPARRREEYEDEEEKRHEASTAASTRAREKRRKTLEERRRRREELGEDTDDEEEEQVEQVNEEVRIESGIDTDDENEEENRSKRAHSARQAAAIDTANEGLKVVASFLEQVVSAIELEVTDVTVRIQHQPKVGSKQTTLLVKLPWVHFSDLNKDAKEQQEQKLEEEKKEMEIRARERAERREVLRVQREHERERRRIERITRGDTNGDQDLDGDSLAHEYDAEAEAEAEAEASIRRAFEARLAANASGSVEGPKYEYHKAIRFHGFRVELHEETAIDTSLEQFSSATSSTKPLSEVEQELDDTNNSQPAQSEPQTIISGSMDQTCIITLKLKMQDTTPDQPKLESTCFIQSLRALLTPKQLALLMDLSSAIGLSAKQVALNAQQAQQTALLQSTQPIQPIMNAAGGGYSPAIQLPTNTSASAKQQQLSSQLRQPYTHPSQQQQQQLQQIPSTDQLFDVNAPNSHQPPPPSSDQPVIHMWSMETHILHCSLTLTETDEQTWSTDWWLSGTTDTNTNASDSTNPSQPTAASSASSPTSPSIPSANTIVQSLIPGLRSNHLCLSSHHTYINVDQTSTESTVKVTLGSIQLDEYLLQQRAQPLAGVHTNPTAQEFIGFKARPLISFLAPTTQSPPTDYQYPVSDADTFLQRTRTVAAPHLSFEYRNTVDSHSSLTFNEPPNLFFEPHHQSTINSRLTLSCQPATIELDLGLGSRLKNLLDAVTAPTTYLNTGVTQPPSSSSRSETNSFTFDLNRPQLTGEEMLTSIANHQRRRHSRDGPIGSTKDPSSYAQIVLIAPIIHLNILFPIHTPSQQQPHPYTRMHAMTHDPYIDARGILRPERLSLDLHEISLANEVDLTSIPTVADPLINPSLMIDSEWMIRFHKAQVFMHYPNPHQDPPPQPDDTVEDLEIIQKRILSTIYPTAHPSASHAYLSHLSTASWIKILTRASIVPGMSLVDGRTRLQRATSYDLDSNFGGGVPHSPSIDSQSHQQHQEEMFFDGLPNVKHWESETLNGERKRVFKTSSSSDGGQTNSTQPDAAIFESLAIDNSGLVVTICLPVAALHLAKYDYDLLLFLYNIFGEITEPTTQIEEVTQELTTNLTSDESNQQAAQAFSSNFAQDVAPNTMYESTLSTQEEEADDQVDINGLTRSLHHRHPGASIHGLTHEDLDFDSNAPGSLSRSDSFSSDSSSEMFESVGGADSVILKQRNGSSAQNHMHRSKLHQSSFGVNSFSQSTSSPTMLASNQVGSSSLLKSSPSSSSSPDVHLSRQLKQYYLDRQPLSWIELKRRIIGVPYGMKGQPQQEAFIHSDRSLSKWIRGKSTVIPQKWQTYQQRLQDLFGQIQLTSKYLEPIDSEDDGDEDGSNAPLTMDSLHIRPNHVQPSDSGDSDDGDDESDEPRFEPTLQADGSHSSSPQQSSFFHGSTLLQQDPSTNVHESNLSDADSDESIPGDSDDGGLSDSAATVDQTDRKQVSFGRQSTVFGRASNVANILNEARMGDSDSSEHPTDEMKENISGSSTSHSMSDPMSQGPSVSGSELNNNLNPTDIFARASRTSGQSQLFQPAAMTLSTVLPPLSEVSTSTHLTQSRTNTAVPAQSTNYGLQSSMMESMIGDGPPDLFQSFLPTPNNHPFDPHASINPDLSIDYSHLPPQVIPNKLASVAQMPPPTSTTNSARASLTVAGSRSTIGGLSQSVRPPPVNISAGGRPLTTAAPVVAARLPSPYKHFLSLRLTIHRASLTIQDEPANDAGQHATSTAIPKSVPQTFHIDIGEVQLFQVSEFEGKPVSYIAIRAGDLTLREYQSVITDEKQLFHTPSMPILFKTMGEDRTHSPMHSSPSVDSWGRPIQTEQKYGDDQANSSFPPSSSPLTSIDPSSATSSVAWSNPVLLINVVMKLKPQLQLRDTQAVINLRALTLQYVPTSQWIQKLMFFFTPTIYVPPTLPPLFNVPTPDLPPPLPITKDLLHIFLHGYDVSIDYNPPDIQSRGILSMDHVHLQTTVYPDSTVSVLKLEVRDVALFLIPRSSKVGYSPCVGFLNELGPLFLHRVPNPSLFAHLDAIGYARLATMDYLDATITQNLPTPTAPHIKPPTHIPALSVEITNGLLTILTCWDSFEVFTELIGHFVASIQEIQQVAEIDVRFDEEETQSYASATKPNNAAYQITASAAINSETSGGFTAKAFSTSHQHQRAAYLLDEDEEEDVDGDEEKKMDQPKTVIKSSADSRNILDQLDHNAFGLDLGVAQVYTNEPNQSLDINFNDNYHDDRHRQTSLSLALQAAAEREIARARREELNGYGGGEDGSMSMYGMRRANSSSPPRRDPSTTNSNTNSSDGVSARWLSARESDELVEKDKHEAYLASLPDDESRQRETELARAKDERRRRREEEREKQSKKSHEPKDQRHPPKLIDDHVPLADEETRSGRARLKPPPDYPNSISELLLLNLTVCWRMFGGQDWDLTLVPNTTSTSSATSSATSQRPSTAFSSSSYSSTTSSSGGYSSTRGSYLTPDDTPEVNNNSMNSVAIMDFYDSYEPFVKPPPNPFAATYGSNSVRGPMMTVPLPAGGFKPSSAVLDSYTPAMARDSQSRPPNHPPPQDVIRRGYRQTDRVMEVLVKGASVRFDQFPTGIQIASRVVIALDEIEIHDLITTSPFKNFLCYYSNGSKGRELGSSMLRMELTSVRPDPTRPREEYRVKLSILPLRLNVDQEAINFFIQFFSHPSIHPTNSINDPINDVTRTISDADAISSANFHELYRDDESVPLTPARAELLTSIAHFLKQGGTLPSSVPTAGQARVLIERLLKNKAVQHQTLLQVLGYPESHIQRWLRGEYDDTVGVAAMQLLNQLLPSALSTASVHADGSDDDSDGSDDELSSGIGGGSHGAVIGVGGGRSPLRRKSDPLESFQPFTIPTMPIDWIPAEFTRQHGQLVPILVEGYHKYYDVCHSGMTQQMVNAVEPWRPTPTVMMLQPNESLEEYRSRVLATARTAARSQLKLLSVSGVREVENQVYIQSFQVMSKITLCIDWKPNTFDLKGLQNGDWAQLANLLPLENMELDLKAVRMTGITGFGRVGIELLKLWSYDLSRHQAHKYLAGVQPIRSLVNVGAGVADLVLLPVTHYHHHGNLKRGVQRGLSSFLKNVSLESMSAAARLAQGAQTVLESVDDVLTFAPTPLPPHAQHQYEQQRSRGGRRGGRGGSVDLSAVDHRRRSSHISKQANPPGSIQDGFRQAYESLSRGLQSAATQMIVVPRDEYQRYGSKGAIKSALKSMPSAILTPTIGAMEAVAKVLNGITNSIDPKRKKENEVKFKSGNA